MKLTLQLPSWIWPLGLYERLRSLEQENATLRQELWAQGMRDTLMAPAYMTAINSAHNYAMEHIAQNRAAADQKIEQMQQQHAYEIEKMKATLLANRD